MTPWLFPRPRRCQSGTQATLSMFGFAHLVTVSSLNVALFFPLSFSMAAEIHIQLLSEPPLTEFRVLDMGLSLCPSSLSINPSDGRDPGGQMVKLKEEQNTIHYAGMARTWLPHGHQWMWQVSLFQSCHSHCQGSCLMGPAERVAFWAVSMFCLEMLDPPSSILLPHITRSPSRLLFSFGNPRCHSTK